MDIAHRTLAIVSLSLPALLMTSTAHADEGSDVAWQLRYYYSRTLDDCGSDRPLIKCSGLRVRGTDSTSDAFVPWDPSPASISSGGVSFSFLRKDVNYQDLGLLKKNGYILKPDDLVDLENNERDKGQRKGPEEMTLDTLCFFPIDAWTDYRGEKGCGDNRNTKDKTEKVCQDNQPAITSSDKWVAEYLALGGDRNKVDAHQRQCGFGIEDTDARKKGKDDAAGFWAGIQARRELEKNAKTSEHTRKTQDEIRTPVWNKGQGKELPIFAFIYTPNDNAGATDAQAKALAQKDQRRYYKETRKWVPVIQVNLPKYTDVNSGTTFVYNEADQAVKAPKADPECTSYIKSAKWERREDPNIPNNPYSLMITPTECGRKMTKPQQAAAYAELYAKYGTDKEWNPDNGSMYQQFVCHLEWSGTVEGKRVETRNKSTWNLEPVRPRASWDDVFKEACNPY